MSKNLKKLTFAKEELVNLNEYEMSHIKGGEESAGTTIEFYLAVASLAVASIAFGYDVSKDWSWWYCPKGCECDKEKDEQNEGPIYVGEEASATIGENGVDCYFPTLIVRP